VAFALGVFGLAVLVSGCSGSSSQCLRAHGYPNFPDPTALGSQALPAGIDTSSPQFQATEAACEKQAQKALGVP